MLDGLRCPPFARVVARMGPSDSLVSFGFGSGSPCCGPTARRMRISLRSPLGSAARHGHPRRVSSPGMDHRLPVVPAFLVERRGPPRFLGRPLATRRSQIPRQVHPPPALTSEDAVAFRPEETLGTRKLIVSWLTRCGSPTRLPTHRRTPHEVRRKAGFRLVGRDLGRAGFAPAGRLPRFQKLPLTPFPRDQPCLVAPSMALWISQSER